MFQWESRGDEIGNGIEMYKGRSKSFASRCVRL